MTRQTNNTTNIRDDISTIKERVLNLTNSFNEFKVDYREYTKGMITKVDGIENRQILTEQKTSGMAVFQSAFAIVIGAIASYLGITANK